MSAPYAIAQYLSGDDKRRMLAHRYTQLGDETPVSVDDGSCPLAYVGGIDLRSLAPEAEDVARILVRRIDWPSENLYGEIFEAAMAFIDDWDDGKITDLHAALGVED